VLSSSTAKINRHKEEELLGSHVTSSKVVLFSVLYSVALGVCTSSSKRDARERPAAGGCVNRNSRNAERTRRGRQEKKKKREKGTDAAY
jgi:hypothetical protein